MEWLKNKQPPIYYELVRSGYPRVTSMCLAKAGCQSLDDAIDLLENEELLDPALIDHIEDASDLIFDFINKKKTICIFGDYDADGVTSSAILKTALSALGAKVLVRLPDRFTEGYGISIKAIDEMLGKGTDLFITVDNGIRALNEVKYAQEHGAKVIILDHHEPGDEIPNADVTIDLKCKGTKFPDSHLTGAGLAYKVACYLLDKKNKSYIAYQLSDLAAIGTIADVEILLGENRRIVKKALELMHSDDYSRGGILGLYDDIKHITAEDIAFSIAPCLNAPGRLSENGANLPFKMLIEDDYNKAVELAMECKSVNRKRKEIQKACRDIIYKQAQEQIEKGNKVLVIISDDAGIGIVGLLAGNLKEEFNRPTIVFGYKDTPNGKILTGSARSIEEYSMIEELEKAQKNLNCFLGFGGHRLAAGMSCKNAEDVEKLRDFLNSNCMLTDKDLERKIRFDLDIREADVNDVLFDEMDRLEPFGVGFPKPVFRMKVDLISKYNKLYDTCGTTNEHLKLFAEDFSLMGFGLVKRYEEENTPRQITVIGQPSQNFFKGKTYNQFAFEDYIAEDISTTPLLEELKKGGIA